MRAEKAIVSRAQVQSFKIVLLTDEGVLLRAKIVMGRGREAKKAQKKACAQRS